MAIKSAKDLYKDRDKLASQSRIRSARDRVSEEDLKKFYDTVQGNINYWMDVGNSFVDSTNSYYNNLDTSSYGLNSSNLWKNSATARNNWLTKEADNIDKILTEYGRYFDSDWISSVRSAMSNVKNASSSILKQADKDIEYWQSWDEVAKKSGMTAEEAYKNSYFTNKYKDYSYEDILKASDEIRNGGKEVKGELSWLVDNADNFMSAKEAQAEIDAISKEWGLDDMNWFEKANDKVQDFFRGLVGAEDPKYGWAQDRIAKLTTIKANAERKDRHNALVAEAKGDVDYNAYVSKGKAEKNNINTYRNDPNQAHIDSAQALRGGGIQYDTNADKFARNMTNEEYNNYAYFLGKYGEKTANEYLSLIEENINSKEAEIYIKEFDKPFLDHIFNASANLDRWFDSMGSIFSDGYEAPSAVQIANQALGADKKGIEKAVWDTVGNISYQVPNMLGGAVLSSILGPAGFGVMGATTAGTVGQLGLMGLSTFGGAKQEMLNLGYSEGQAFTYGALTAASEMSLGYLLGRMGNVTGVWTDDAIKSLTKGINSAGAKFAIEFGAGLASEGLEEALQEILDPVFMQITTGKKAEDIDWGQVAYAGMLGALSAGVLNGLGAVGTRANELSLAKDIKSKEGWADSVKNLGNTFAADTLAYKLASKVDENTGAWKLADVIHEMHGTLSEQNVADIKYELERSGVLSKDAQKIAEYLAKAVDGESLTALQRKALDNNPVISKVFKDVIINKNSTVNQRLQALMDLEGVKGHAGVDLEAVAKSQSNEALSAYATLNQQKKGAETDAIKAKYNIGRPTMGNYDATLDAMVNKVKEAKANAKINEGGVTTNTKTGKQISINRVTETDGKTATFALADGTTISNKDVEYSDNDEGLLYEGAIRLGYDTDITNAVIHGFKGVKLPATTYLNGVEEALEYGRIGYPMDKISTEGFFAELPKSMQTYAYNLGKETAKKNTEKAQARIDANKGKVEETREGKVVHLYEKSGLTPRQKASIDTLGKVVSDITHNKVYIFDTVEKVINGKKVRVFAKDTAGFKAGTPADNGFINKATGEVYIDLHAGMNGEGVILWTLSHELTHFVRLWSPAKFNVLADFLMAEYGNQGVDVKELIDTKIANSKRKNLSRDEAYEEVVADAMQTMFTDTDLASKLEKLKNKDKGLWNKIKQFFADLYKRVKGEYKNVSAQTEEAQKVREMGIKAIERISNLFADAVVDAGNTYANVDIKAVASGEVDIDGNKSTHAMSIRSMVEGAGLSFEYDEKTGQMRVLDVYEGTEVTSVTKEQVKDSPLGNIVSLAKQNGFISDAEANKQYGFLADLVKLCLNYKENFTMVWEIAGTQVFSAIKANSDTQYGKTIDFSTVCKKTQQVINVISETQKRLKRGLTKDEIKNIVYYETGKAGEPTPCPVCYVFSRWMGIGGILQQMSDFQKKYEGATEEDMRNFINDVESEIVKHANTPNKKGEVKKAFFDKNGKVKFGSVIADLKSKANSKIKSANIRLKIQETETLLSKADLKDKAKLQKTLNRLNAKLAKDGDILDARLKEAEALMSRYEEYQWLTKTYMDEVKAEDGSHIGWKRDENFKPVDEDVLWDLREGARFATEFPKSWLYRTTKGCNAGKAILPYSDARVGETIQGVAYADVKDILTGEHNAFLNGDVKAQADYMTKAIKKQLAQNLIGGMRYQSTSDFRYEYGSDYLITFLEMQAIGAKVQLYTKVIEAVDFLCTVGAEVNLSVMPLNDGYIELEDGRKQLVFSSVTGINAEAAIAKTKQYDNAQLILVGISDEHIRLALEGDDVNGDVVTFVIPFHGSGNTVKAIQELMDLLGEDLDVTKAQDYSLVQTDHFAKNRTAEQIALWELRKKIISRTYKKGDKSVAWDGVLTTAEEALLNGPNGSKYLKDLYNRFYVDKSADEYGVSLSTAQAEQIFPYEYWDKSLTYAEADMNGERFKEYCATMGIVPRFSGVDSSGKALGYGDFTNTKGYWKLLIDRKMYNNDGTYHSPKQINVTNFKAETLNPAWGSATYGDVMQKDTNPKKTNAITENVIRQIEGKAKDNFMFSVRNIVGASGTDYGIGVYLDSTLLSNLTETERIEMVKEYVKELGGKQFSAFDKNGDKVNISIAESNKRFKNKQGKRVPINKDLTEKYIKNEVKQESIALVDELILASSYDAQKPPLYPHDWVDNNGQNDWEYWVTYVQDKENTIWEATLNIATTANGEKILYDINPIKKVEQSVESDTSTTLEVEGVETIDTTSTDNRIAQDSNLVNSSEEFSFSERTEAPPTKTEKAYKLMRLVDGKLYPLFIGNNEEVSVGTWYNADSPNLSQLKNLAPGTHLVDMKTGEAMTWDEYAEKHVPKKNGKPTRSKPNIDDVHWANDNGYRFMHIEEKAGGKSESRMLKQYGDTRAYYNWGVNGSSKSESGEGSASLYALRPGWHFGEVPTMHQIGYDGVDGDTVRLDNQVWVEVEMSADVDYNAEAASNWGGDIPTHIPTNGYYKFATNPTQKKTKGGNTEADLTKSDWYVAGAFKVNRILSDSEADSIVENYNKTNGKNVPLDYRRNYGRVFNAETMMLEDRVMFSERILMGSLFSGGGTLEAGLTYQMLDKQFGVEYDGKIASVYTSNHGDHIQVGRVEDFDISKHNDIFYLHASPVCHNFSKAKHGAKELQMDIDSAKATAKHLETAMPQVFTVENAPGYRKSQSLKIITDKLTELGYKWDVDVYNSADYGSATSRNRVILRAVKDGELPAKPTKQERTNSWDKVTRDLWNTLPKSSLRPSFISAIENTNTLNHILDANGKVKVNKPLLILTTTNGHTVTYSWEGEICPTLTTKCGEAKLVMPDGNIYAVTPEFMGRIQGLPTDYKYPKEKTRAFTIIGNGIPTHLTKAVVGGVLDSAYQQTHDGDILYSERNSNATDNRTLLANALESVAQNDVEREWLTKYKSQIESLNEDQNKLAELRAEIQKIRFTKGQDRSKLPALENQAKTLANRISKADKKLLDIEVSKPLKGVLERERAKAYKLAADKGREVARERREGRQKTELRHKIKAFKSKMESRLLNATDNNYVPQGLAEAMITVCELINTDTSMFKKDGSINKAQEQREISKQKLRDLRDEYENLKSSDPLYAGEFDETVYEYLKDLENNLVGRHLSELSLDELQETYDYLRAIEETLMDAKKLIGWGEADNVYDVADSVADEQAKVTADRKNGKRNALKKGYDKMELYALSPMRNVERMSSFNEDSKFYKLFKKLEAGVRKKNKFKMESYKLFEELTTGKNAKAYEDAIYKEVGEFKDTDINGRIFGLSKMQMMQAILSLERENANEMNHIREGGFNFADLDLLRKGKLKEATSEENSHRIPYADHMAQTFADILKNDEWAQKYMAVARQFFNEKAKDAVNETTLAMKHRIVAKDKSYIPFEVDRNFILREISAGNDVQQTINSYGMLQATKDRAPQPIYITGLNNILDRHIDQVATLYGLGVEVRNFNKVWKVKSDNPLVGNPTIRAIFDRNWGADGVKYLEDVVQNIQSPRKSTQKAFYRTIRSNLIGATFLFNLSVVSKQIGSLFASTSMLGYRTPVQLLGNLAYTMANYKKISAEVDQYTATAWMRRQGLSDGELQTLLTEGKKTLLGKVINKLPTAINPTKWIEGMDSAVALSLWKYAKADVAKKNPNLKGEELMKATAEFYDDVVEYTQSMADELHRPEVQKEGGIRTDAFGLFKTDLYQMSGQALTAIGRYANNPTKGNAKAIVATVNSIVMNVAWTTLMTTAFALLRYKVDHYRDDDDEDLTAESWLKKQGWSVGADIAGYVLPLFGSEIVGIIDALWNGPNEDAIGNLVLDGFNSAAETVLTAGHKLKEGESLSVKDAENLLTDVLSLLGVPANNINRFVNAMRLHAKDIANGEFLSFEAGVERSPKNLIHKVMEAIEDGDTEKATSLFEDAVTELALREAEGGEYGDAEINEAKSKLKTALGSKYKDGDVSVETATEILYSVFGMTENDIYWQLDQWDYAKANGSTENYSKYDDIFTAMEEGDPSPAIEWHIENKTEAYVEEARRKAEQDGKAFNEVKAKKEAEKKAESAVKSAVTSYWKPKYKEAYEKGDTEEMKRIRYMLKATKLYGTTSDLLDTVKGWLKD